MIVYLATNQVNGKRYVGITTGELWKRRAEHKHNALRYKKHGAFQAAIRKHGWDAFEWRTLCECTSREDLKEMEAAFIRLYGTRVEGKRGYNRTDGGDGVYPVSEATREIRRRLATGRKASDETRQRMSEAQVVAQSAPHLREAARLRFTAAWAAQRDDISAKISAALTGRSLSKEHRKAVSRGQRHRKIPVQDFMKVTLRLAAGESMRAIAREYGCSHEVIRRLADKNEIRSAFKRPRKAERMH